MCLHENHSVSHQQSAYRILRQIILCALLSFALHYLQDHEEWRRIWLFCPHIHLTYLYEPVNGASSVFRSSHHMLSHPTYIDSILLWTQSLYRNVYDWCRLSMRREHLPLLMLQWPFLILLSLLFHMQHESCQISSQLPSIYFLHLSLLLLHHCWLLLLEGLYCYMFEGFPILYLLLVLSHKKIFWSLECRSWCSASSVLWCPLLTCLITFLVHQN